MFNDNNNLKRSVGQMERHAFDNFDSFDPEMYDPEMYDASSAVDPNFYDEENDNYTLADGYTQMNKMAMKKRKFANSPLAQLDIVITNNQTAAITVELFNFLRSNTMIRNLNYNTTVYEPQTLDKSVNRAAANSSIISDAQMIYWRSDGSLVYNAASSATLTTLATNTTVISCPQVPFRVLHEATRNNALYIEKFRLSVGSSYTSQFDNPITYFKNTFLGGTKSNQLAPRSEFKPNQFQSNIIDLPAKITIDAETGLSIPIVSQATLTMTTFFKFVRGNETGFNF